MEQLENQRLAALLEYAQDIIILVDGNGSISYVNPGLESITGYRSEEIVGDNAFEFIHPDDREAVWDRFQELIDSPGQATERVQHRLRTKDGGWRWMESISSNHTDAALDGYVINTRDITERKERERKMARQQALLEAQQAAILDGMLVVDETGDIVSYNDRFVELWDIPDEVMAHESDQKALDHTVQKTANPDEFRERIDQLYDAVSETSRDEIELADGRVFDRYTTPLTSEDGTYFGRLWTFRDVTDRIDREDKLRRSNDRLEEFASVVSHDLRNPLNVATLRTDLARQECDSEHLETVAQAHGRIETLIEDLLTLAREGRETGELDAVDLQGIVEDSWTTVETGDATLQTEVARTIRADESRLTQLLENLLRNAIEHGGDDVVVTVGELEEGFYLEDDGPGIPAAERDDVFEAGYTTSDSGTGFGLAIVRQVATAHGWDVAVTEGTGGGTRFEITNITTAPE